MHPVAMSSYEHTAWVAAIIIAGLARGRARLGG